jgi:hypothetical protein
MRVSLLWQAVLAFTNRIPPLPGLMQASSTPALFVVASFATGTAKTSRAIPAKLPTTLRLTDFVVICSPLGGAWATMKLKVGKACREERDSIGEAGMCQQLSGSAGILLGARASLPA